MCKKASRRNCPNLNGFGVFRSVVGVRECVQVSESVYLSWMYLGFPLKGRFGTQVRLALGAKLRGLLM